MLLWTITGYIITLKRYCRGAKLLLFKLEVTATVGKLSLHSTCPLCKEVSLDGFLGVGFRSVGIVLAEDHCDFGDGGGGITLVEGLHEWGMRAVPLLNYTLAFALHLRKSMKNLSRGSRVFRNYSLRRLGCLLRDSLGWHAELHFITVTLGELQSALGQHECLSSSRNKGFPASANFESKPSVSA
jgi:hypothetical protein